MVGGPIAAILADAAAGGVAGGYRRRAYGKAYPEHRAKQYEKSLREGSALISVHTQNEEELKKANEILAAGGAEDLNEVVGSSAVQ